MASRGVNKVIIVGNVGDDPDIRTMPNGNQVVNLSIATSDSWKDKQTGEKKEKTEWHRCVFFNKIADIAAQYVNKGSKLYKGILNHYHQMPTSTDHLLLAQYHRVPPSTIQHCPILTCYHQVPTITALY